MKTSPDWLAECPAWENREVDRHFNRRTSSLNSKFIEKEISLEEARNRRRAGEPLEYILGHCHVDGLTIKTDPRALIPRQETETLVRMFSKQLVHLPPGPVVDCGTGSGFIAAWLAAYGNRKIIATDIDAAALELARENFRFNNCRVSIVRADRLSCFSGGIAAIVANLPYVEKDDPGLDANVEKYEPHRALFAGQPLLDFYKEFLSEGAKCLLPSGQLWLEAEPSLIKKLNKITAASSNWSVRLLKDNQNRLRFLALEKL
ncbi:MAG: HemK/PrmC family methyltransferase [bacterium]